MTAGIERASSIACTGAFLAFLDTTIVNIAFPDISASFPGRAGACSPGCSTATSSSSRRCWCRPAASPTASATSASSSLGIAGFTAASLLCAVAPSLEMLIAFRVLQGVGAAAIAPTSLAIVLDSFPAEKRATGVGLWGAAAAAAAATGPTLGGALVELSDWRLVFLVNLPLGAALAARRPAAAAAARRSPTAACPTCRGR